MAVIGIRYPIWSPYVSGGEGAPIVYGTAVTDDHAIMANIQWTRNTNVLYGDDVAVEIDNAPTSGTISFQYDHLSAALRASMLGETETGTGTKIYEITDATAPYGGFGYITTVRNNGSTTYEAYWYHQVQFHLAEESAQTRGENIEWQTPTLEGHIFAVDLDGSGELKLRQRQSFATQALAVTWLDSLA